LIDKRTLLSLCIVGLLSACATAPAPKPITDLAASTPQLSTLSKLINDAGLADTLRGTGPFTVFAPSDDAFKAVPAKTLNELAADKEMLRSVLTFHIIAGDVPSAEVKNGPAKTLQGANVALSRAGTFVTIEDAVVTQPDARATNGVVHIIDRVLIPPKR
jgi:uncharacterized surface protein with fasciclin (FAS1) repeats